LSTPDDWRLRAIAGAYWEDNKLYDQTGWNYKTVPPAPRTRRHTRQQRLLLDVGTAPGTTSESRHPGDNTSFYQDTVRETKQTAFFASADFDIIPKVLTLTAGTRHFRFDNSSEGSVSRQLRLLRGGAPAGRLPRGDSYNLNSAEPARHRIRLQEPRQPHLAHHAGHHGVLHLLAGLSPGRLQSERRHPACLRPGWRAAVPGAQAPTHPTS
jgi:hypothetical protein